SARGRDPREIAADPARLSTRATRVERQLHAVAQAFAAAGGSPRMPPSVNPPLRLGKGSASGSESLSFLTTFPPFRGLFLTTFPPLGGEILTTFPPCVT